jgi:hypothetical protein
VKSSQQNIGFEINFVKQIQQLYKASKMSALNVASKPLFWGEMAGLDRVVFLQ